MTTLREAAQQALEALEFYKGCYGASQAEEAIITALKAALADHDRAWYTIDEINAKFDPKPVQEPVQDWSLLQATQESLREHMAEIQRLRAAPPRKPLTEEEIAEASAGVLGLPHEIKVELARAVERAHGIKE